MWTRDLVLALVAVLCTFVNVPALMVVAPQAAEQAQPGSGQAGLLTAVFAGATVVTELMMPTLLARFAMRRMFPVSLTLLGLGSLAGVLAVGNAPALTALAVVRGLGFGVAVVGSAILVAELAPASRRGEAIGYLSLCSSVPNVVGPAAGLWLLERAGFRPVFALTGAAALVAASVAWRLRAADAPPASGDHVPLWHVFQRRGLLTYSVALTVLSATYGGIISFAPLVLQSTGMGSATAFFLVYGIGRGVARWLGGAGTDRFGSRAIALPGLGLALLGLGLLAASQAAPFVLVAAALYGLGSGMTQSAILVGLLAGADPAETRLVSTVWNLALDLGVSAGGAGLALVAATQGYDGVLRVLPLCAAGAVVILASAPRPATAPTGGY